eukprot:scaffold711_cov183-Ochromonas_danica.AAC.2
MQVQLVAFSSRGKRMMTAGLLVGRRRQRVEMFHIVSSRPGGRGTRPGRDDVAYDQALLT